MGRARLVLREKVIDEDGNITEFAIWQVPGRATGPGNFVTDWHSFDRVSGPRSCCTTITIRKGITGTSKGSRSRTSSSTWMASWPTSRRMYNG